MKISRAGSYTASVRVRADLARLTAAGSKNFLSHSVVHDFLRGKIKLDYETAQSIIAADKAVLYIEKFVKNGIKVKKTDHIIALLCIFSEDSFGARILSDEFYDYAEELQDRLDACKEHNYHGVHSAVSILDFLSFSDFLEGRSYDVWFLLYNLFLQMEGLCLILEDSDVPNQSLLMNMKYKIENYAQKLQS